MLRIKCELRERGLSQAQAARAAGVGEANFSRIVRGIEPPYPKRGQRIADALGWEGDWQQLFEKVAEDEWAIAATLGAGTCRNISKVVDKYGQARFACSECGAWLDSRMLWNPEYSNGESPWVKDCKLNYCPNCGRKVVDG